LAEGEEMKKPKNSKSRRRGQALSEYLILTALIGVASISVVQMLSKNLRAKMSQVSEALRGHRKTYDGEAAQEKHYKSYDLGDFSDGMTDSGSD
jgi:Flp pilus assembly pilin Flp